MFILREYGKDILCKTLEETNTHIMYMMVSTGTVKYKAKEELKDCISLADLDKAIKVELSKNYMFGDKVIYLHSSNTFEYSIGTYAGYLDYIKSHLVLNDDIVHTVEGSKLYDFDHFVLKLTQEIEKKQNYLSRLLGLQRQVDSKEIEFTRPLARKYDIVEQLERELALLCKYYAKGIDVENVKPEDFKDDDIRKQVICINKGIHRHKKRIYSFERKYPNIDIEGLRLLYDMTPYVLKYKQHDIDKLNTMLKTINKEFGKEAYYD